MNVTHAGLSAAVRLDWFMCQMYRVACGFFEGSTKYQRSSVEKPRDRCVSDHQACAFPTARTAILWIPESESDSSPLLWWVISQAPSFIAAERSIRSSIAIFASGVLRHEVNADGMFEIVAAIKGVPSG
jgi:hypothetical protein